MRPSDPRVRTRSASSDRARPTRTKDAGYVTAETAMAFPALVLLVMALTVGVAAVAAQIRCVDAAQVGARAASRGEPPDRAHAASRGLAPRNARTELTTSDGQVHYRVTSTVRVPGPWPGFRVTVGHTAVLAEESAERP